MNSRNWHPVFIPVLLYFLCSTVLVPLLPAQESEFNLGLDKVTDDAKLPDGWDKIGTHEITINTDSDKEQNKFVTIRSDGRSRLGVIRYFLPIKNAGKRLTLTAKVKANEVDDSSQVMVGIAFFRGNRRLQLVSSSEITRASEWKSYSVSAIPPPGADRFALIGALIGSGTVSFDQFHLATWQGASKELNDQWTSLYPAEADQEFDSGSTIETLPTDDQSVAALDLLGRVWGFVKYHHPTIASGQRNWDYELFRFLPKYLGERPDRREALLLDWVEELGDFEVADSVANEATEFKLKPDLKWIESIKSEELAKKLKEIQTAKRSGSNYYLSFTTSVGNPIFYEESYQQFEYPDAGFRLLALYRHWNMIQYYFPYRELTDKNWNHVLTELIPRFAKAKDALDYRLASMELISDVQDTHAQLFGPDEIAAKFHGTRQVPIELRFVENQLVVVDRFETGDSRIAEVQVGDIVVSIDGTSVADWIADRGRYHWASNEPTKMRNIARSILRTNQAQLAIEFRRGEKQNRSC